MASEYSSFPLFERADPQKKKDLHVLYFFNFQSVILCNFENWLEYISFHKNTVAVINVTVKMTTTVRFTLLALYLEFSFLFDFLTSKYHHNHLIITS